MHTNRHNRGSALVMVIGLLALVFVLGLAFRLSSRLDAQQSRALAEKASAEPLAEGIVAEAVSRFQADLHIANDDGPFSAGGGWLGHVDSPETDTILASMPSATTWPKTYPRVTNLWPGTTTAIAASFQNRASNDSRLATDATGKPQALFVNTDGDGYDSGSSPNFKHVDGNDAILLPVGPVSPGGDWYFAAVTITDNLARLNLNTAARFDGGNLTNPIHPVNMNLYGLLGNTNYPKVHAVRSGGTAQSNMALFDKQCAQRLLRPTGSYLPFPIGDEVSLRWLSWDLSGRAGQLYRTLYGGNVYPDKAADDYWDTPDLRSTVLGLLTTWNATSTHVRKPTTVPVGDTTLDGDFHTRLYLDTSSEPNRNAVFARAYRMLSALNTAVGSDDDVKHNNRCQMAASFVANLWALQDPTNASEPWAFVYRKRKLDGSKTNEDFDTYAFGTIQRPVITEAYAMNDPDLDNDASPTNDSIRGAAIELTTFSSTKDYAVRIMYDGVAATEWPTVTLPRITGGDPTRNGRIVLWFWERGPEAPATTTKDQAGFTDALQANGTWIGDEYPPPATANDTTKKVINALKAFHDGKKLVFVYVHPGTGLPVPLDAIKRDEIGYDVPTHWQTDPALAKDARRDDDPTRCRYNVATALKTLDTTGTTLGTGNGLAVGDVEGVAQYPVFLPPETGRAAGPASFAELAGNYFTAPIWSDPPGDPVVGDFLPFSSNIAKTAVSNIFANLPARGRYDLHPTDITRGDFAAGDYPDVPTGTLMGEFFSLIKPDPTRPYPGMASAQSASSRVYGKVNVNTSQLVLLQLPWPSSGVDLNLDGVITSPGETQYAAGQPIFDPKQAVEYILAYRDHRPVARVCADVHPYPQDYTNRYQANSAKPELNIQNLRKDASASAAKCYLTPGEIAIPLMDYIDQIFIISGQDPATLMKNRRYQEVRQSLYHAVADLIDVRSNAYAVNIAIWMGDPSRILVPYDQSISVKAKWHYVAVIDRGNCIRTTDRPQVVLFTQVK